MFCLNYILLDLLLFYYIEKSHINCNITLIKFKCGDSFENLFFEIEEKIILEFPQKG